MATSKTFTYDPLATDDIESNILFAEKEECTQTVKPALSAIYGKAGLSVVLAFFLLGAVNIGFVLGRYSRTGIVAESGNEWNQELWNESLLKIGYQEQRFDATLFGRNKFRGPPSAAIDAEWDRYTTNPWMVETAAVLAVSAEDMRLSGNDARNETVVRLDVENGGGHMGSLELFHQLHCLNVLRKWTYLDYYKAKDMFFRMDYYRRREHADHCIDVLRQVLMCNGDLGLILFHWVDGVTVPTPNFNTLHQCRDPEQILGWAKDHAAPIKHDIQKQQGDMMDPHLD